VLQRIANCIVAAAVTIALVLYFLLYRPEK